MIASMSATAGLLIAGTLVVTALPAPASPAPGRSDAQRVIDQAMATKIGFRQDRAGSWRQEGDLDDDSVVTGFALINGHNSPACAGGPPV